MKRVFGTHLLAKLYDCDQKVLNNIENIRNILKNAAINCGVTIIDEKFHLFAPVGVSGILLIAESHISIHA